MRDRTIVCQLRTKTSAFKDLRLLIGKSLGCKELSSRLPRGREAKRRVQGSYWIGKHTEGQGTYSKKGLIRRGSGKSSVHLT